MLPDHDADLFGADDRGEGAAGDGEEDRVDDAPGDDEPGEEEFFFGAGHPSPKGPLVRCVQAPRCCLNRVAWYNGFLPPNCLDHVL